MVSKERVEEIVKRCKGSILDVGCVVGRGDNWLHGKLTEKFDQVLGIDIQKEKIEELRKEGYNVIYADAENFELNKKFDTIVAGELIDLISNPGKFLDCCRKHLKDNGRLIITIPNGFNIELKLRRLFEDITEIEPGRLFFYNETALKNLAGRHGFKVVEVKYIVESKYKPTTVKGYIWHRIIYPILLKLLPQDLIVKRLCMVLEHDRSK
jgi:SAM-dependent methyltransferase